MQTTVDRLAFTLKQHVRHSSAVLRAAEEIGSDLGGKQKPPTTFTCTSSASLTVHIC